MNRVLVAIALLGIFCSTAVVEFHSRY